MKNKLPLCLICHSNKHIINDGSGSTWGSAIIGQPTEDDKILSQGVTENHYYCTKCLTTFDIRISYKTYKDSRPKLSGHTGCH